MYWYPAKPNVKLAVISKPANIQMTFQVVLFRRVTAIPSVWVVWAVFKLDVVTSRYFTATCPKSRGTIKSVGSSGEVPALGIWAIFRVFPISTCSVICGKFYLILWPCGEATSHGHFIYVCRHGGKVTLTCFSPWLPPCTLAVQPLLSDLEIMARAPHSRTQLTCSFSPAISMDPEDTPPCSWCSLLALDYSCKICCEPPGGTSETCCHLENEGVLLSLP